MDDVTRAMSKGGGACGYLCKISGKSTPLPPLTKAFPYAYGDSYRGPTATSYSGVLGDPLNLFTRGDRWISRRTKQRDKTDRLVD